MNESGKKKWHHFPLTAAGSGVSGTITLINGAAFSYVGGRNSTTFSTIDSHFKARHRLTLPFYDVRNKESLRDAGELNRFKTYT